MAAEIKASLETGVLKNHRNDTFTRLARNTARTTHAYKKAQETRQQKKTLNIVDEELASLKDSQKENAARIKELKTAKSNITKKGKSLKAESSSSGKVAVMGVTVSKRKRAEKASRLATVREGMFLQSIHVCFEVPFKLFNYFFPLAPAGIYNKRATLKSKQVVLEDIDSGPFFNMSMDTTSTDSGSIKPGNLNNITIDFNNYGKFSRLSAALQ